MGDDLGRMLISELLAFYSVFADTEYPWLSGSWECGEDFTQLTINTREGITWSDGVPFTAADVHFTLDHLLNNDGIRRSAQVQRDVEPVELVDDTTVVVNFLGPASEIHVLHELQVRHRALHRAEAPLGR